MMIHDATIPSMTVSTDTLGTWLDSVGPREAFESISALLPDATVMVVDADRNVVHWSEGAEKTLGFSADEVLGNHCLKAHSSDCTSALKILTI